MELNSEENLKYAAAHSQFMCDQVAKGQARLASDLAAQLRDYANRLDADPQCVHQMLPFIASYIEMATRESMNRRQELEMSQQLLNVLLAK